MNKSLNTGSQQTSPIAVQVLELGQIKYGDAWERQKILQRKLIDQEISHTLLVCEHPSVITLGKSAKSENLLFDQKTLSKKNVDVFHVERGGDVTFHGPGQLVAYPILNLNAFKRDVGWYMRQLEETVIRTADSYGIRAQRIDGRTGVWIIDEQNDSVAMEHGMKAPVMRKLSSIGVRLSRWCTMHGVGFNVLDRLEGFSLINPCGFTDIAMTSLQGEIERKQGVIPKPQQEAFFKKVSLQWLEHFKEVFEVTFDEN